MMYLLGLQLWNLNNILYPNYITCWTFNFLKIKKYDVPIDKMQPNSWPEVTQSIFMSSHWESSIQWSEGCSTEMFKADALP